MKSMCPCYAIAMPTASVTCKVVGTKSASFIHLSPLDVFFRSDRETGLSREESHQDHSSSIVDFQRI